MSAPWRRPFWILMIALCSVSMFSRSLPSRSTVPRLGRSVERAVPSALAGGGPWGRLRKPLHEVVACFGWVLGATGLFLAFASGPVVAVLAWMVAGLALQVCGT